MSLLINGQFNKRIEMLPDEPGIYLFYNVHGELVYVGKATSLKSRVTSYFRGKRTPRPIEELIHEVADIDWRVTDSVLEAVIVESSYIKKFLPKYNVMGKDNKSWNYIIITNDEYPQIITLRQHELALLQRNDPQQLKRFAATFGPYPGLNTKAAIKILRRLFHFSSCEPDSSRPCLYYEMGLCYGVCVRAISPADYKKKVINLLKWFLSGKKRQVIKNFERRMKQASKAEDYEEATLLRNQLKNLYRIHDVTLINKSFFEEEIEWEGSFLPTGQPLRIEGYDISNLGPTHKVGSMVVFNAHGPVKSEYRKFNIKTVEGQNDVDSLAEVLERRLKRNDWDKPDVVLLDGGLPQINRIKKVFIERGVTIPFVGIAKGAERKSNNIILGTKTQEFVNWVSKHQNLLIRVRDEAHRFAIAFNRSKRKVQ